MTDLPDIMTHNYDPSRGPFRNICGLAPADAERVLDQIRASGPRQIRPNYLERRLAIEQWLRAERVRKLGTPPLQHPIYFFLGDFADGQDLSRPQSIVLPLANFAPAMITFTYPDSMASLPLATDDELVAHRRPYHGRVFTLEEIKDVVAEFGMPTRRPMTEPMSKFDRFIEVQVWDDTPIKGLGDTQIDRVDRRLSDHTESKEKWGGES